MPTALEHFPRGLGEEVGVDEAVKRAVEDGLRVPDLVVGAVTGTPASCRWFGDGT